MSEYQYYEFQAVDRLLSAEDRAALRAISTRARITSTSFTNHYEWGDLKANPVDMMARWFDLHVYMAHWYSRTFMVRLPHRLFDPAAVHSYASDWSFRAETTGDALVLVFQSDEMDIDPEDDGSGWIASLASLRAQLLEGDLRCLYLGWLLAVQKGDVDEDEEEPPRPPGLSRLDGALESFVEFFQLNGDLLAAAAEADDPAADPLTDEALEGFIHSLPAAEKDGLLLRLVRGQGATLPSELRRRCRETLAHPPKETAAPRRVGDLLAAADARARERERIEAERAAAERVRRERAEVEARARRLDGLAKRGEAVWREVEDLIDAKRAAEYDQAVRLLLDLKALAERDGWEADFASRVAQVRARHLRKSALVDRLDRAGLSGRG